MTKITIDINEAVPRKLSSILEDLGLTEIGYHSIVVNGKRAEPDTLVTPQCVVVVIPQLPGG